MKRCSGAPSRIKIETLLFCFTTNIIAFLLEIERRGSVAVLDRPLHKIKRCTMSQKVQSRYISLWMKRQYKSISKFSITISHMKFLLVPWFIGGSDKQFLLDMHISIHLSPHSHCQHQFTISWWRKCKCWFFWFSWSIKQNILKIS